MKFKICNGKYDDFIILEGETIEEIRKKVAEESNSRGWNDSDCWSEEVKD